jgi:iron(III) transport system ATP-binding protein
MSTMIQLQEVSKAYGTVQAARNVSFEVEIGKIMALLGASGCGKTTVLRLLSGLERPDTGEIRLHDRTVAGAETFIAPENRQVGMVFQDYALFPHLTVAGNISFSLNHWKGRDRRQRVDEVLSLVGLPEMRDRYPHQLSGGQQQRIALARALAPNPGIVLLDEPFSNLDAALRKSTREEVRRILKAANATAIFVTHDQEEALSIADVVGVMRGGELLQVGSPQEVYLRPADRRVAAFVGEANFVPGTADGKHVATPIGSLPLARESTGTVEVLVRPEMVDLKPDTGGSGVVDLVQFLGYDQIVRVQIDTITLQVRTRTWLDWSPGMRVSFRVRGGVVAFPQEQPQPAH